jgi:uncharacterized protein YndB with AHSA1/START domain
MKADALTVSISINAPILTVWDIWTDPAHITHWCFAQDDWEAPYAENDVRVGGRFMTRMQAKDGSAGFDFGGTYTVVLPLQKIVYTMDGPDAREVEVTFSHSDTGVLVTERFDIEHENPAEMQRVGWQAILHNFKVYAESHA